MFEKMSEVMDRLDEVVSELSQPETASDPDRLQRLMREQASLTPVADTYKEYLSCGETIRECEEMLSGEKDEDMREMLREEKAEAKEKQETLASKLQIMLLPHDPNDDKNVVMEIRAGVGGDEAALFAAEVFRMYSRYCERRGYKMELTSVNENGLGGFKEAVCMISGGGAYSRLKYESGVHRVQRVPETESGGRIHTSAVTVSVMPQADEIDFHLDMNECKFDVYRASGNGGQCVNTTDSAVRLTHLPTGIVVTCQDEKSQLRNKEKAVKVLRAMLYQLELMKQKEEQSAIKRSQVGSGDRSEKIRTYNFPQSRVTDHRIHLTIYKIDQVMDGDLDLLIDPLIAADQAEKLAGENTESA